MCHVNLAKINLSGKQFSTAFANGLPFNLKLLLAKKKQLCDQVLGNMMSEVFVLNLETNPFKTNQNFRTAFILKLRTVECPVVQGHEIKFSLDFQSIS